MLSKQNPQISLTDWCDDF